MKGFKGVRMDEELERELRKMAELEGRTESEIIRDAVKAYVGKRAEGETELEATLTELYVIKAYATQLMRQAMGDAKVEELKEAAMTAAKRKAATEARRLRKG
jgi:metal-responsive CopG/Arc/MetJ family transcriptional regulator